MFPQRLRVARYPNHRVSAIQQFDAEIRAAKACRADDTDCQGLGGCHGVLQVRSGLRCEWQRQELRQPRRASASDIPLPSRLNMQFGSLLYASPMVSWGMLRGSEGKLCGAGGRNMQALRGLLRRAGYTTLECSLRYCCIEIILKSMADNYGFIGECIFLHCVVSRC